MGDAGDRAREEGEGRGQEECRAATERLVRALLNSRAVLLGLVLVFFLVKLAGR